MTAQSPDRALCAGRYRLERPLGRGPSGVVYQATDVLSGAPCVLKRLHAQFHDEGALHSLQRDILLCGQVAHPAIGTPRATGFEEDGTFYLVSDPLPGEPLAARLVRGVLSPREITELFQPLCEALETAHRAGLHHGDLTPTNLFCTGGAPALRIIDFGMHQLGMQSGSTWGGTPGYLPPESYRGEVSVATARGDVFSLGAILYECLTGQRLFSGPNAAAVMFKVCVAPLLTLPAAVPERDKFEAILAMACDRDPEARFDHAGALWRALSTVVKEERPAAADRGPAPASPIVQLPVRTTPPRPLPAMLSSRSTPPRSPSGSTPERPPPVPLDAPGPATALPPAGPPAPSSVALTPDSDLDGWLREEVNHEALQRDDLRQAAELPRRPRLRRLALWAGGGGLAMAALLLSFGRFTGAPAQWEVPAPAPVAAAPGPVPAAPEAPATAPPPPVAAAPAPASAEPDAPAVAPPAPVAAPESAVDSDASALLRAEELLSQNDLPAAQSQAEELLRQHPQDPAVKDLNRRVQERLRLQAVYDGFLRAAERGDTDAAVALYQELPVGSPFRTQAQVPFRKVRERFESFHLQIAGAALKNGECGEVERQAQQLILVADDPEEGAAATGKRMAARCKGAPTAAPPPVPPPATRPAAPTAARPDAKPATKPELRTPPFKAPPRKPPGGTGTLDGLKNPFEK